MNLSVAIQAIQDDYEVEKQEWQKELEYVVRGARQLREKLYLRDPGASFADGEAKPDKRGARAMASISISATQAKPLRNDGLLTSVVAAAASIGGYVLSKAVE